MAIYLTMILTSGLFAALSQVYRERHRNFFLLMAFVPLLLVSALRVGVGVDFENYRQIYEEVKDIPWSQNRIEPLYFLLAQASYFLYDNFQVMVAASALLTQAFFWKAIKAQSCNTFLSVLLYITAGSYFSSLCYIRQYLGLGLVFMSYRFLKERRFLPFAALVLLAAMFHKSMIIALPLYVLTFSFPLWLYFLITGGLVATSAFSEPLTQIAIRLLGYEEYVGTVHLQTDVSVTGIFIAALVTAGALAYRRQLLEDDPHNIAYLNFAVASLWLYALCWWIPMVGRVGMMFTVMNIVSIPKIISMEKSRNLRLVYSIGILAVFFAFWYMDLRTNDSAYLWLLPYQWILG